MQQRRIEDIKKGTEANLAEFYLKILALQKMKGIFMADLNKLISNLSNELDRKEAEPYIIAVAQQMSLPQNLIAMLKDFYSKTNDLLAHLNDYELRESENTINEVLKDASKLVENMYNAIHPFINKKNELDKDAFLKNKEDILAFLKNKEDILKGITKIEKNAML